MKRIFLFILVLSHSAFLFAKETKRSGELGATFASGNTDIQTINAKLAVEYAINDNWGSITKLDVLNSTNSGVISAEKYELNYEANYKISNDPYYYAALNIRTDRIGGLKLSNGLTGGIAYTILKNEKMSLLGKAGFGYRSTTSTMDVENSEVIFTTALNYKNKLSKVTDLTTDFSLESGSSNTLVKVDLGVLISMAENLAFKYSVGTQTNSNVATDVKKTDILQTVNLVYGF